LNPKSPLWRGSVWAAICVAAFVVTFYLGYARGHAWTKALLWLFAIGAILGGVLSSVDSTRQILRSRADRTSKRIPD